MSLPVSSKDAFMLLVVFLHLYVWMLIQESIGSHIIDVIHFLESCLLCLKGLYVKEINICYSLQWLSHLCWCLLFLYNQLICNIIADIALSMTAYWNSCMFQASPVIQYLSQEDSVCHQLGPSLSFTRWVVSPDSPLMTSNQFTLTILDCPVIAAWAM